MTLRAIFGQSHAISALQSALASQRIPHAWIFHGPRGVGKMTTALAFASVLLDPEAAENADGFVDAQPDSRVASRIAAGDHADVHVINKKMALYSADAKTRSSKQTVIPLAVVNEYLIEPAHRSALEQDRNARARKVFIVDEAEMLATEGQNRLLKTLEEPPAGTIIILITTHEDRLLPTIRSRCRRVPFSALSQTQMRHWLARSGHDASLVNDPALVRFADGSPGQFELAVDHDLQSWCRQLSPQIGALMEGRYADQAGTTMGVLVDELAKAQVSADKNASKQVANRLGTTLMFTILGQELRSQLHRAVASGQDPEPIMEVLDLLPRAESQIAANANFKLVFENLTVQWADTMSRAAAALTR